MSQRFMSQYDICHDSLKVGEEITARAHLERVQLTSILSWTIYTEYVCIDQYKITFANDCVC